jgi:hypothetical protein
MLSSINLICFVICLVCVVAGTTISILTIWGVVEKNYLILEIPVDIRGDLPRFAAHYNRQQDYTSLQRKKRTSETVSMIPYINRSHMGTGLAVHCYRPWSL